MAPRVKKRRASDAIILSSPPKKFRVPIYISSSSDDEGSPPAKKTSNPRERGNQKGTILKLDKDKEKAGAATSTRRGPTISIDSSDSNEEVLSAAAREYELLRSWVDAGIDIATREMTGEDCKAAYTSSHSTKSNQPPLTSSLLSAQQQVLNKPCSAPSHLSHTQSSNTKGLTTAQTLPPKSQSLCSSTRHPLGQTSHNISPPVNPAPKTYNSLYTPRAYVKPNSEIPASRYVQPPILPPAKTVKTTTASIPETKVQKVDAMPADAPTLAPKQVISLALETSKPLPPNVILPPGDYLGFYDLVDRFVVPERDTLQTNHPAWILWLEKLGIDDPPYQKALDHANRSWFKANVEDCWAKEHSEKRRVVEKVSIWHKYGSFVNLHRIPLRERDVSLSSSVPFHEIERHYFCNIRTFSGHDDVAKQRHDWVSKIGFCEAQKYPLLEPSTHTQQLDELYNSLHILQRKTIFSHAKYLKLLVKPPAPSWGELEDNYAIYPASCFTSHAEYKLRRREWLKSLELDSWPFSYVNMTEKYNGVAEIEWSEKSQETRLAVENHARAMKDNLIPYAASWQAVEDIFGFSLDLDFSGRQLHYRLNRNAWLRKIDMGNYADELVPMEALITRWTLKSFGEKRIILEKARTERESFCRERLTKSPNPFLHANSISSIQPNSSMESTQSSSATKPASNASSIDSLRRVSFRVS